MNSNYLIVKLLTRVDKKHSIFNQQGISFKKKVYFCGLKF